MRVYIRRFDKEDALQLSQLDKAWKNENISPGFYARSPKAFIEDSRKGICFLAAEAAGQVIGYGLGEIVKFKNKSRFYVGKGEIFLFLDSLYVSKQYRSRGIGKKIVSAIRKEAQTLKVGSIHLITDSKKQGKLVSFYRSCGFKCVYTRMKLEL